MLSIFRSQTKGVLRRWQQQKQPNQRRSACRRRQLPRQAVKLSFQGTPLEKQFELLKPLLSKLDVDLETLYLAGITNLQFGDGVAADAAFARAARLAPNDSRVGTALAMRKFGKGDSGAAFAELTDIAAKDKGEMADLALIGMRMRRREYDAALAAVENLDKKRPSQALVADMRGQVLLAKRDTTGARASFERALSLSPAYLPAAGRLAALDMGDGKFDLARQRIESVLKADPKHNDALMALADLKYRQGGTVDQVAELYRAAQVANPTEKGPRMALTEFLLERRAAQKALVAAREALASLPNDVDVLEALGRAQLANGQAEQHDAPHQLYGVGLGCQLLVTHAGREGSDRHERQKPAHLLTRSGQPNVQDAG